MAAPNIERGYYSVEEAAQYVGIAPEVIKRAIEEHELRAYIKPVTRASKGLHVFYKIPRTAIDEWVEGYWQPA